MADILIVDDDPDVVEALSDLLTLEGHSVRTARDGLDGLSCLDARLPDVVLLDIEMPQMTGPEMVYRMFVDDLGRERVPVVLVSGKVDLPGVAAEVGTPYALGKPYTLDEITAIIDRALRERAAPRPRVAPVP